MCAEARLIRARVRGGWKSQLYEYARLDRWLPGLDMQEISPDEGRAALAAKYFDCYGPATEDDFTWWSGFTKAEAKAALAGLAASQEKLVTVQIDGVDHLMLARHLDGLCACPPELPQGVRLLPVWDAYLMAYKNRNRYLLPEWYGYVYDNVGNATNTVLLNGIIGGVWDIREEKPLAPLSGGTRTMAEFQTGFGVLGGSSPRSRQMRNRWW